MILLRHILLPTLALLLLAGCGADSPETRIAAARQHLQKNDTKAAVIEIKNALQANPETAEARYLLGSILLKEGNVVGAEVELRKAQAAGYPADKLVPELARAMLLLGQGKKLVDEFGTLRLGVPAADASLQTTLVAAYATLGKREQALAALDAALAADPLYAPALLLSARQKAGQRDYDGALRTIDAVIERDARDADAWKLKGDILLYALNKPDDALAAYRKAIDINPRSLPAQAAALALLTRQGQLDEAAKQLAQLKALAPGNPTTKFFEAQLAYYNKDLKRARELTQQLVQVAPNDPRVLQIAGAVELASGSAGQAEIYLSKALQAAPDLALARRLLIAAYLRSGQSAKALAALNAAAGKDGLAPDMYSLAGEVYLQNGDPKKAEEYFAKALKLDPDNARKRTALAITHLAGGQTTAAIDELQNVAAADSGATADLALISVHLRRKEFDKALAAIDRLEAKQPDKPLAANLRGRVQLALKDVPAARKSFEKALSIDPGYFAAAASLAALDVADKKPDDAKKRFEGLLARNPKNAQALLALAELAMVNKAGKDEVAGLLTRAIDANPTEAAPRLMLIELHLRDKDTKQALAVAQSANAAVPTSPELLTALGRVQQVSGDVNQAIATYGKLAALQPLSPVPHLRLAEAQIAARNNVAAEQSLRKALEIKPDLLEAQRGLVQLAMEGKRYPEALKIARSVQVQQPKAAEGYALEGDIANAQRQWPAAAVAYKAALDRQPLPEVATRMHAVLLAANSKTEADRFASAWVKDHPKDGLFLAYLAELALAGNDFATAEKHYLTVLRMRPENVIALNNLAWVMAKQNKQGALEYAEKANQLAPDQPALLDTLSMLLADKGEYRRAIDVQAKALAMQPQNSDLRLNLAKIYIKSGDKQKAKEELEILANLGDKIPSHGEVKSLLTSL